MRLARWIDHLPPWLAWGAVASMGTYEPVEIGFMSLPLLGAAFVEWNRWDLGRWRRVFEIASLFAFLLLMLARIGLVPSVVQMLFLLCGVRLALPRETAQRRQVLLMGFAIWLTTAISTLDVSFLFWSLAWVAGAALVLLQQSWEPSASLRRSLPAPPPYFRVIRWSLTTLCISALFFVILPRLTLGLRMFPWGVAGLTTSRAGLSDVLDLGGSSNIQPNNDVVLRILPATHLTPDESDRWAKTLSLLRGIALEEADGLRWKPGFQLVSTLRYPIETLRYRPGVMTFDYYVAPSPHGIIPLPYGVLGLESPHGMPMYTGPGGSLRWNYPSRRPMSVSMALDPSQPRWEATPRGERLAQLMSTGSDMECAERWSRQAVPENLPPRQLAHRLASILQRYRYTLDNPSGSAPNPMEDFLERSHAGHCEYFAASLAAMLRRRGVPARVVNGYRLGPWISEGGYWIVTQNEVHSWVEFFDPETATWCTEDPTPAAPPNAIGQTSLIAALQRWMDTLSYQWDRHVVRFSDQDQVAGMEWLQQKGTTLLAWRGPSRGPLAALTATLAAALALGWAARRFLPGRNFKRQAGGIQALKPLLRRTRKLAPPAPGETARTWLNRLAELRPGRTSQLRELADAVDAEAYGTKPSGLAAKLARAEASEWRKN